MPLPMLSPTPLPSPLPSPGILILSAPSGGGKTSLARALVAAREDVEITVSHTTRGQRRGEENGIHYHFVDNTMFEAMIGEGKFIEYATVFDHYYGTSIASIEKLILSGKHAILDIDWQGARKVREKYPTALSVFVMPPSTTALKQRLQQRQRDSDEVIAQRMKEANNEMSHKDEFDIIIINTHFDSALAELEAALNRLKCAGQETP